MNYMGIDHHKQYSFITVLDEGGDVVKTGLIFLIKNNEEDNNRLP